ncbi:MAG: hypothetical protein IJD92_03840 [Bacilli bacterium]|nr:hypothetical protein [Bacilli bacterium]
MKVKYFYKDGKIEVIDDNDLDKNLIYDYQDNIHEIFELENINEYLEKEKILQIKVIKDINKKINSNNEVIKICKIIWISVNIFMSITALVNILYFIIWFLLSSIICYIPYISKKGNNKMLKKEINAKDKKIKTINIELKKNNNILKKLYEDKKITQDKLNHIKKKFNYIFIREELEKLKKYLMLVNDIGYNEKEYRKYYNKDILEEKLKEEYNSYEIKLINKYFEDNKQ